jgi:hypothetical protein
MNMTRIQSTIIALTAWITLAVGSNGLLASAAQAQQTQAQAYADAKYQEYLAAHEMTFRNQQSAHYNYYLSLEQNAWNVYTQAQWAAQQALAYIQAETARVGDYIQNHLYDNVNQMAYANDPNYRAQADNWVQQEAARGNAYIVQLWNGGQGQSSAPGPVVTNQPGAARPGPVIIGGGSNRSVAIVDPVSCSGPTCF